jgi:hypothetical protein
LLCFEKAKNGKKWQFNNMVCVLYVSYVNFGTWAVSGIKKQSFSRNRDIKID